jgi:hypothetical protein
MKWLIVSLVVLFLVTPAVADDKLYIAVVGNDINANDFYIDFQQLQFLHDQTVLGVPIDGESFSASTPINQAEICDVYGVAGEPNARVAAGDSGWYEWSIRLPEKPSGDIDLLIKCAVLKPNSFALYEFSAVELCAAETGGRTGDGCTRQEETPGMNPLVWAALPTIIAEAQPGPNAAAGFTTPFNLTSYRNPGSYVADSNPLEDNAATQVLDGTASTRVLLKSCMDKTIVVKIPVAGQINVLLQTEYALEAGDIIHVHMNVPKTAGVEGSAGTDIYCHSQSLSVMGIASDAITTRGTLDSPGNNATSSIDMGNGEAIAITYSSVSSPGRTYVATSSTGPSPPVGFQFGNPPTYYNISTTSTYTPPITVCITYNPAQYTDPSAARLLHWENDDWMDVTTSRDVPNHQVCGQVNTLSPFAIAERVNHVRLESGSFWIGLKNSDDQGTQFDVQAELYLNGGMIGIGENLCVTGVTRNPSYAKEIAIPFNSLMNPIYDSGDVLSVRVLTRIGTTPSGQKCTGPGGSHNNAVGLRLYYDAPTKASNLAAEVTPISLKNYYLHSTSGAYFLDHAVPTGTVKYRDSAGVNYNNGNPWKEIGIWSMTLP